ncbi:Nucleic acid binding,RNA binding [Pelomyxa schiedti]|nr:Nucleic acid binding,RNA binding [Pelomyxa schiedti]
MEGLQGKLSVYESGLQQVEQAIVSDPHNDDLLKAREELLDVIKLTKELLQVECAATVTANAAAAAALNQTTSTTTTSSTTPTDPKSSTRDDEVEAAYASLVLTVGAECEALAADESWKKAVVQEVCDDGNYVVSFSGATASSPHGLQTLPPSSVRPLSKKGKKAGKVRKYPSTTPSTTAPQYREIPKSLKIYPNDTPQERKVKKRKIHAIKSQNRLKKLEDEGDSKKMQWQNFLTKQHSVASKKAPKESIFKSPDTPEGKVGVVGSGKPLTNPVGVREKWKFGSASSSALAAAATPNTAAALRKAVLESDEANTSHE